MEISEIKQKLTLSEVIKHYGYKADKQNRINCPFHDDKTPSMQLYWKTHTAYCFSSNCKLKGKSIDVIDFILHKENSTKHEAIKKAQAMITGEAQQVSNATQSKEQFLHVELAIHHTKLYLQALHRSQTYSPDKNRDRTSLLPPFAPLAGGSLHSARKSFHCVSSRENRDFTSFHFLQSLSLRWL